MGEVGTKQSTLRAMVNAYIFNTGTHVIGKKWRTVVLWHLRKGPLRFSQIRYKLQGCSVKVLSEVLQELEDNRYIIRTQYETIPVKVTYELREEIKPFIKVLADFRQQLIVYYIDQKEVMEISSDVIKELEREIATSK
jgi:DNA-binding HxlR family transcriptional regulator